MYGFLFFFLVQHLTQNYPNWHSPRAHCACLCPRGLPQRLLPPFSPIQFLSYDGCRYGLTLSFRMHVGTLFPNRILTEEMDEVSVNASSMHLVAELAHLVSG